MRRSKGFILVNALIIVLALSSIAVLVLSRAEQGVTRRLAMQEAQQMRLYLDGFEAYAQLVLERDRSGGGIDHLTEPWARQEGVFEVDRGRLSGQLQDLQGRFNINWLVDTENLRAAEGFETLARQAGLAPREIDAIRQMVTGQGLRNNRAYLSRTPPESPVGGPLTVWDQLRSVAGLRPEALDRLRPYASLLPAESALNINTAPEPVLVALFPDLSRAIVNRVLQQRRQAPFETVDDFLNLLRPELTEEAMEELERMVLSVSSAWFLARARAELGKHGRTRRIILHRRPLPQGVMVAYRADATY